MAATYLKGSFLRAVCNHLRATFHPIPHFYVQMMNPPSKKKKWKGCRGEKKEKVFKINVNLFASHLFPFFWIISV